MSINIYGICAFTTFLVFWKCLNYGILWPRELEYLMLNTKFLNTFAMGIAFYIILGSRLWHLILSCNIHYYQLISVCFFTIIISFLLFKLIKYIKKDIYSCSVFFHLIFWIFHFLFLLFKFNLINTFFNFKDGGLAFFGAILFCIYFFFLIFSKKMLLVLDKITIIFPIGIFIMRIGNYFNKDHMGNYFLFMNNYYQHPVSLYEAFGEGLFIFYILQMYEKKLFFKYKNGTKIILFLIYYCLIRIFLENFRNCHDNQMLFHDYSISVAQCIYLNFFFIMIIFYYILIKKRK